MQFFKVSTKSRVRETLPGVHLHPVQVPLTTDVSKEVNLNVVHHLHKESDCERTIRNTIFIMFN